MWPAQLILAENWSRGLDVNGRDRDETETSTIFLEARLRRDVGTSRDRDVETETTTLSTVLSSFVAADCNNDLQMACVIAYRFCQSVPHRVTGSDLKGSCGLIL